MIDARGWPRGFVPTLELSSQKKEREGKTGQVGLFALPYLFLFPCLPVCLLSHLKRRGGMFYSRLIVNFMTGFHPFWFSLQMNNTWAWYPLKTNRGKESLSFCLPACRRLLSDLKRSEGMFYDRSMVILFTLKNE